MAEQQERSEMPNPRRRRSGRRGPGKPFGPGTNSHNGQVFRRGADVIPRGDIKSLYRLLMEDDGAIAAELLSYTPRAARKLPLRLQLGRAMLLGARSPRLAAILAEQIADRLEGKPVQKLHHQVPHATYFYQAGGPKPPQIEQAERLKAAEQGTPGTPASVLEVLPPPVERTS